MRLLPTRPLAVALVLLVLKSGLGQVPPPAPEPRDGGLSKLAFDVHPAPLEEARLVGLPAGSKHEVLNWQRTYTLALIRARDAKPSRFDSLDAERLIEKARGLGIDDFARFQTDFVSAKAFSDPSADLLNLQARLMAIENAHWNVDYFERWAELIKILVQGESSGLRQMDIDQFTDSLSEARRGFAWKITNYRDGLDALKVSLGLSAHAPVTVDSSPLAGFRDVFEATNRWSLDPRRQVKDLGRLAERLPSIGDVSIEGHAVLSVVEREPDRLEEMLSLATRTALRPRREGEELADAIELRVRRRLRHLAEIRADYAQERRSSVQAATQLEAAFEQVIAPPATPPGGGPARPGQTILNLVGYERKRVENRDRLVLLWTTFRAERLAFYRDLGLFPFENWSSFYDQFTARATDLAVAPPAPPNEPALPPAPPNGLVLPPAPPNEPVPPPAPQAKPRDDGFRRIRNRLTSESSALPVHRGKAHSPRPHAVFVTSASSLLEPSNPLTDRVRPRLFSSGLQRTQTSLATGFETHRGQFDEERMARDGVLSVGELPG